MRREDTYFEEFTNEQLWRRYCGFLDLTLDEFRQIQEELLLDQIQRIAKSKLGMHIMGAIRPTSVDEFRAYVPLTTYQDYEPYLSDKEEDSLAEKPLLWSHSAGRSGKFKWIPHSQEALEKCTRSYLGAFILASCSRKGEINIRPGFKLLATIAPPPYTSAFIMRGLTEGITMQLIPPYKDVHQPFQERVQKGFLIALRDGVDVIGALTSVLAKMGEEFGRQSRHMKFSPIMLHPLVLSRMIRALIISRKNKRPMLPKDIWKPKAIICSGLDTSIYKDAVEYYWGSPPHELYAGTEGLIYAMQSWARKGLTFLPDMVFLEFLPYRVTAEAQEDTQKTLLIDELKEGELYEVIISQLYGMPLLRYRTSDVIKVISKEDSETGIRLPQIEFQRRAEETIGLAGLAHLDEKIVWQALRNTKIDASEWMACKEYEENRPVLRLYIELKGGTETEDFIAQRVDQELKEIDTDYRDVAEYIGSHPVRVSILSAGTFQRYTSEKLAEGADLAHLKPVHINPSDEIVKHIIALSS